jgi:phosphoribosylformimino-5-aminoimidazole carboxamide ribotide isomerase
MIDSVGADRLAVAIDTRKGSVALRGWTETSTTSAQELAEHVVRDGVTTVVYTDIERDGMLGGPDLEGATVLRATGAAIIVSGGVASTGDIQAVCKAGLQGAIVGKALYEGLLSFSDALQAAAC